MVGGRRMTDSRPRSDSGRDKRVFGSDLITSMEAQRLRESWLELDVSLPSFLVPFSSHTRN